MTNREKYKAVFGFDPNYDGCPAKDCDNCPIGLNDTGELCSERNWWGAEYKETKDNSIRPIDANALLEKMRMYCGGRAACAVCVFQDRATGDCRLITEAPTV